MNDPQTAPTTEIRMLGTEASVSARQIAPGVFLPEGEVPPAAVPNFGFCSFRRVGPGVYEPVIKGWGPTLRMTRNIPRELGLSLHYETLLRLIKAGIVKGRQLTPSSYEVDLNSLHEHVIACEDPEYWTRARRMAWASVREETAAPGTSAKSRSL